MKKWLVALVLCLAIMLGCCVALADGIVIKNENGTILNDGDSISGKFYYKLYFENVPEGCNGVYTGWTETMNSTEPDSWEDEIREFEEDENGQYLTIFPWVEGEYIQEIMFVRVDENSEARRIEIHYDRTATLANSQKPEITNQDDGPAIDQRDYTLNWTATEGTEFYNIVWDMPGDEDPVYFSLTNSLSLENVWGNPTGKIGQYHARIFAFANGRLLQKSESYWAFEIKPVLTLADYNEEFVKIDDGTSAEIQLNQWVQFTLQAPGARYVDVHAIQEGSVADESSKYDSFGVDENGNAEFQYIPLDGENSFQKQIVAIAYDENNTPIQSNEIGVYVNVNEPIVDEITYSVPADVNTLSEGRYQVARNGRFFVDVENIDVDFFGLYIADANGDWIADSHWVPVDDDNNTGVTRVPLTVEGCDAGEYEVHVFAIKFGAPQKDAETTIPITVTDSKPNSEIVFGMKNAFVAGEPLRIRAFYKNTDNKHPNGFMQIQIFDSDNEEIYNETKGYSFWEDGFSLDRAGEYRLDATVYSWDEEGQEEPNYVVASHFDLSVSADKNVIIDPITLPSYIIEGQALSFTVTRPTNAESYYIGVWCYDPDLDRDFVLFEEDDLTANETVVEIPANGMPPVDPMTPKNIQIHIYGCAYNANAAEKHWDIPLIQAPDTEHPVSIALVHPNDPIQLNQNVEFRVSTTSEQEIKLVCIYDGYNYSEHEEPNDGNAYNTELSFWEEKTYPVYALVTFDEAPEDYDWEHNPDPRTWYTTNVIEVTPTKTGDTGAFSFGVDCDVDATYGYATVTRGDDITITYQAAEHATHYWIDVEQYNEDQHNWNWFMHDADLFLDEPLSTGTAGTAILHTIDLPTGYSYRLTACAESTGYFRSFGYLGNDEEPLSLEVEASDNVAWSFTGVDSNYEIWTHDEISFGVYVPGSINTEIAVINSNGDEFWRDGADGDSFSTQGWGVDSGDEFTFRAIAQVWNENLHDTEEQVIDYPHTITVKTRGELPAPVVAVDFGNNQDGVLFRGQQISFSFEENEDLFENGQRKQQYEGVWYNAYLWNSHGEILDNMEGVQPGTQLAFTSGNLGANDTYRVSVDIQKQQYTGIATDVWFMLLEGETDPDHTVTLTVDEAYINCQPNVEIPYTISAPGSVVVQIYADNEWREWWEDMPDTFTRSRNFDTGERLLMARASWENPENEEDRIWAYSNPVILHVYGDRLPAPTLTLASELIHRGSESLTVTISEGDMTDIEMVRKYYIHVNDRDTEFEYIRYGFKSYEMTNGTITLDFNTFALPEGEYRIQVDGAADGYDWGSDEAQFVLTGGIPFSDGVYITATPTIAATGNTIMVTAYAPGATCIKIYERSQEDGRDDEEWDRNDGECLVNSYSDSNPNTHQLYAMAWYNDDDPNEAEGTVSAETVEVSFTAENQLDAPMVFYSSMLDNEDDFWVEMGYSEGATEYHMSIRDESITEGDNSIYSVSSCEPISVTLPRNQFVTGHVYAMSVDVSAPGCRGNYREYQIIVASPVQNFTLTVNGYTDDTEIPVNRNFSVLATAPAGATGISVLHPDGWWNDRCGRTFEEYEWNVDEARGSTLMVARYTTYAFPEETQAEDYDWSQFDWNQVEWAGYSNPVNVAFTAVGQLPEFTYTIESTTITQGEYINVTLTNVDTVIASIREQLGEEASGFDRNQLGFYAMIQTQDGRDLLPHWYEWDGIGQINVPTAEVVLNDGNNLKLLLNVNYSEGWVGWGTEDSITINAAQGNAYFVASKTNVITSEGFTMSLHVPDAVRVAIYEIGTDEGGHSYADRMSENNGDTLVWMHSYGNSGTFTLYAYAQYEEDPEDYEAAWIRVNGLSIITMTVTAGESQVINGTVTVPNRISGNSNLTISWSSNTNLDKVDLQIHCVDEGRQVWHSWHPNNQTGTTIPAIMPQVQDGDDFDAYIAAGDSVFESGHIYRAQIYMQKVGWEADYHEVYFTVDDAVSRTLTLPSALTTIENEAFAGVNANRIEIGSNVETIEYRAFADIEGLVYADFANSSVGIEGGAFENTRVVILCYQGSDAYNYARGNNIPYLLK